MKTTCPAVTINQNYSISVYMSLNFNSKFVLNPNSIYAMQFKIKLIVRALRINSEKEL